MADRSGRADAAAEAAASPPGWARDRISGRVVRPRPTAMTAGLSGSRLDQHALLEAVNTGQWREVA